MPIIMNQEELDDFIEKYKIEKEGINWIKNNLEKYFPDKDYAISIFHATEEGEDDILSLIICGPFEPIDVFKTQMYNFFDTIRIEFPNLYNFLSAYRRSNL
jgi:hypothetical protein